MSENWAAAAADVEAAIASLGDVSQAAGYPATIRRAGAATGDAWNPTVGAPTYYAVKAVVSDVEQRDINGTVIASSKRMAMISGLAGVAPTDNDKIILGQALTYVDATTDAAHAWQDIQAVRTIAPAGVAVMYELDLAI